MRETVPSGFPEADVHDRADHLEVTGLSKADLLEALDLLAAARDEREKTAAAFRHHLARTMVRARMPLLSAPAQRQAQRASALRETLLEHGYETYPSLAAKRGSKESSVRTWVSRKTREHHLFTVQVGGHTIVPAVQLTEAGDIRTEVAALTKLLSRVELDRWSLWTWLCTPTDWLSGETPAELARTDPDRVRAATVRYAQQLSGPGADLE